MTQQPHRRQNPLTGQWVLVSPHRMKRPWLGQSETPQSLTRPTYDPDCYLCPRNTRANGQPNPDYQGPWVFDNDFPAILHQAGSANTETLFRQEAVRGTCRVICFSPRHDLTLPQMEPSDIRKVVDVWANQIEDLGEDYAWVQIFENKGSEMGCSNPHPHGQIWATEHLPSEVALEDRHQQQWFREHGSQLLLDYLDKELEADQRIVTQNESWVVLVPWWALWPFEVLLLPRRHIPQLHHLSPVEKDHLALILKNLLTRYDNLFQSSFPYSMGWHGAPFVADNTDHWQLHAHFYPPMLRSASVRKHMVGYEMLGEPQRDLTPESAAQRLASMSDRHWSMS